MDTLIRLPSEHYQDGVKAQLWQNDLAQHAVLKELDRIYQAILENTVQQKKSSWWSRLFESKEIAEPILGLYFWGGVGRGKTFLVDLFFNHLPITKKYRTHFHRFMQDVNQQLQQYAGQSDPLSKIAKEWSQQFSVLVLDEFFVTDIGDAMLLSRLLEALFAEGVILITTSNTEPDNLYLHGLQRESFLPAIDLLKKYCVILYAEGKEDYRLRALTHSPVYQLLSNDESEVWLKQRWKELTGQSTPKSDDIIIEDRPIPARGIASELVWFDFSGLCEGARGTADYIDIAEKFNTILVGNIPLFNESNEDSARRFVNFIDEVYDRQVNLICSAAELPINLYSGNRLQGAFERTASRLIEMQSTEYLTNHHRAN